MKPSRANSPLVSSFLTPSLMPFLTRRLSPFARGTGAVALVLSMVAPAAHAGVAATGTMYAVDSNRGLFTIDLSTGARTQVGAVSSNAGTTAGLAYDPLSNTVYLTSTTNDSLYTLDLATGAATLVGSYGVDVFMHGLEWDPSTGTLFGASSTPNSFYSISATTGAATEVGSIGLSSFVNLGYDATNDRLYATSSSTDSLYSIDRGTGAISLIGPLQGSTNPNGLAYVPELQTMFMVDNSTDTFYSLDLSTGAATAIGSTGTGNLLGLVYVNAIPEPGTYVLFALGLAGVLAWRRRGVREADGA